MEVRPCNACHGSPGANGSTAINVTADLADLNSESGGGSGSLDEFFKWLSQLLQRRLIDEVQGKPAEKLIFYQRQSAVSDFHPAFPPKLDPLLDAARDANLAGISTRAAPCRGLAGDERSARMTAKPPPREWPAPASSTPLPNGLGVLRCQLTVFAGLLVVGLLIP